MSHFSRDSSVVSALYGFMLLLYVETPELLHKNNAVPSTQTSSGYELDCRMQDSDVFVFLHPPNTKFGTSTAKRTLFTLLRRNKYVPSFSPKLLQGCRTFRLNHQVLPHQRAKLVMLTLPTAANPLFLNVFFSPESLAFTIFDD